MATSDEESQFRVLLRRATEGLPVDTLTTVERGHERGRALLRRRRRFLVAAAGLVAVFAGATATGLLGVDGPTMGPPPIAEDASGPSTPTATPPPIRAQTSEPKAPRESHDFGVPVDATARTLADLLPSATIDIGGSTSDLGDDFVPVEPSEENLEEASTHSFQSGSVVYDDGRGASLVTVLVERVVGAPQCDGPPLADCVQRNDGAVATTYSSSTDPLNEELLSRYAALWQTNGFRVTVTEWAGPEEKGTPSRSNLPLTTEELAAVTHAAVWVR